MMVQKRAAVEAQLLAPTTHPQTRVRLFEEWLRMCYLGHVAQMFRRVFPEVFGG